jgi:tetratricopeptide (TPR) repeat protein
VEEIKAKAEADRLERERRAEIARQEAEKRAKRNKKIAIITTPIVCAVIAFIIVLNVVIIPNSKYNDAIALMDAGKYTEAITAFEALEGYKDSANKIAECNTAILDGKYNDAIALMHAGKLDEAYSTFIELGDYKDASDKADDIILQKTKEQLKNIKVGSYIKFGAYEQDNNTSNGKEDIEWLVLEIKDGKALVISKYALDCKQYNTSDTDVTWETCTLRKWLNNDFINAAFSDGERAMIPTVTVSADKNPEYSTDPGNATQDQVFLLSITEANKYFSSDSARQCKSTDRVAANAAHVASPSDNCWWWLRSPGGYQNFAAYVSRYGDVYGGGHAVHSVDGAVRPALWIDLDA